MASHVHATIDPRERHGNSDAERTPINLRVPALARELIDRAAAAEGKTRTDFMLDSACRHAREVLLDQRVFSVDADKFAAVVRLLDNPPPPTAALRELLLSKAPWDE